MRLLRWTCLLPLVAPALAQLPQRDYETNDYFAIHLSPGQSPDTVAQRLGAKNEGPLGQLPHHYTFSSPKHSSDDIDITLDELRRRRRRRRKRSESEQYGNALASRSLSGLDGILWSQKQHLRKRLVKRIPPPPADLETRQSSTDPQNDGSASDEEQQAAIERLNAIATELDIQDPIFKEQWHLFNPLQLGHDMNVTGVWLDGITGNGSISAVIDDGLDMYSDDLKNNYFKEGSWDFNENSDEPKPRLYDDKHGTRCAGEIAAVRNNVCGVGMAYDSRIAGIRILSKPISDEDEAASVNYHYQENQIYSCSWGPPDDGQTMDAPGLLIQRAMVNGVQNGRGGLGSIFVFAAGNGASADDNCNFDGYTNSIYSITVGGIDRAGNHPYYSESCSAQMVVTYSSGHNDAIHTTDVGVDKCYNGHGGTSAAGPLVVGTVALALSARPDLTWRDLQYLCIETAIPIHLDDGSWQDTPIGKKFSHMYGYGKVDAYQYVQAAKTWQTVKPQAWFNSPWLSVQHDIPQGDKGLAASFDVTDEMLLKANFERLEHVTVTMNVAHARRGDLSVELRGPQGIVSHLATSRRNDAAGEGYDDWTFMSVAHWYVSIFSVCLQFC
jgi:kexin